jgi:serine/threonine protein kinase
MTYLIMKIVSPDTHTKYLLCYFSGSFGKVYLGEWSNARVAIKQISEICNEKMREAMYEIAGLIQVGHHPNICQFVRNVFTYYTM